MSAHTDNERSEAAVDVPRLVRQLLSSVAEKRNKQSRISEEARNNKQWDVWRERRGMSIAYQDVAEELFKILQANAEAQPHPNPNRPMPTEEQYRAAGRLTNPNAGGDCPAAPCSSITLNFRGDPNKPHDICKSDYDKLKEVGFLWEFYPDAPDVFPTNDKVEGGEE